MITIVIVVVGIFLFHLIRSMQIDMTSRRMLMLFVVYWFVSLILASLQVFGMREVGAITFIILVLGVLSFSIGFIIPAMKRSSKLELVREDVSFQIEGLINNVFFRVVIIVASVYIFTLLATFFQTLLFYGSLSDVRTDYYSKELYGPLFVKINTFILRPLYLVVLPVFAYQLLYKRNWLCLIMGFYLFGYESLGGGRIGYVRIALGVAFIAYCLLRTFKNNKRQGYTIVAVGAILLFGLLSVVSAARKGEVGFGSSARQIGSEVALEHLVTYTAGPIAAFDYYLENDLIHKVLGGYQYGNVTLTPLISFVNLFSSRLGVSFNKSADELIVYKQETMIDLAPDINYWNALYTANVYYYSDFGVFGVILFPFLYGLLISWLLSKVYKYRSLPLVMILSFCMWCMMDSVLDYAFTSPYDVLTFIIMYFIGTRKIHRSTAVV